jgi:ubiquinone/menaquinone biosynthesis C-methylase UbiE
MHTTQVNEEWTELIGAEGLTWSFERARHVAWHLGVGAASALLLRTLYRASGAELPTPPPAQETARVLARLRALAARDVENARAGMYPRSLLRAFPWREHLGRAPALAREVRQVALRAKRGGTQELPTRIAREDYPKYYLRNFHWQTDGWLSERSADLYDTSVEFLFGGAADTMRRMAIPPVVRACGAHERPAILDVGTGTGRFLLQLAKALPHGAFTGLDLSQPYLDRARGVLSSVGGLTLVRAAAEAMPFSDASFRAVTSVFLFHELPRSVRAKVVAEMYRVLEPGGVVVLCDAAQLHDSPELKTALVNFAKIYHEPYFRDYVRQPLEATLERAGFEVKHSEPHLVSKVVVAQKPSRQG